MKYFAYVIPKANWINIRQCLPDRSKRNVITCANCTPALVIELAWNCTQVCLTVSLKNNTTAFALIIINTCKFVPYHVCFARIMKDCYKAHERSIFVPASSVLLFGVLFKKNAELDVLLSNFFCAFIDVLSNIFTLPKRQIPSNPFNDEAYFLD